MSLTSEWRARIESWLQALDYLVYQKLGAVPLEATFTHDQLTLAEASQRSFAPIAPGTRWGTKWEYAWFRGHLRVPEERKGERIVLHCGLVTPQFGGDSYGEWRLFANGVEIGSRDWAHVHISLTEAARGGEEFSLMAEAFGGPTRVGAGGGPALDGVPTIPEPPALQRVLPEVTFGIWREEVFQLQMDVRTLLELRDQLDPDALRVAEIDAALREFTLIADLELPWAEMEPTIRQARERLRPLLECRNGSTAPTLFCVGHSHLDVVYQWPLKETERKVARTFSNQLQLMNSYPEYRFLQSMPVLYDIAKRLHPAVYARVKEAVRRGQWIPEGGMWTEADSNLPNGESLIRQFLYGKRFFQEEFGIDSTFFWSPDMFGFSGALPQIMAGCEIQYFGSSKIFCVFSVDGEPFPYTTFWWEGIDGTRVLSHFAYEYGITTNPAKIAEQWKQNPQKDGIRARMTVYGHSDGGGGCERSHLEFLRRQADLEGAPRCRPATPLEFFHYQEEQSEPLPTYAGEIYLPAHRGTYTTQAALKKGNRRCEATLHEAELWSVAAQVLAQERYPREALEKTWKKVLFNQFHDILPGSCIERAAQEARELYDEALAEAGTMAQGVVETLCRRLSETSVTAKSSRAARHLASSPAGTREVVASACVEAERPSVGSGGNGGSISDPVVFNALGWTRTDLVPVEEVPADTISQEIDGKSYVEVTVPPCGWGRLKTSSLKTLPAITPTSKTPLQLENAHYRLQLDSCGRIISWIDKETGLELAAGPLNDFQMFRDTPRICDAWEIESHYKQQPVELMELAHVECLSAGPLATVVRIHRKLHHSEMEQDIWLRHGSRRVEFQTRIHWTEKHKLLKVCFPLAVTTTEALHEIQFGHLRRPTHRSRPADRDQFEVSQQRWSALTEEGRGIALLNDCKYGISAEGNTLGLSLLKAPQAPDMHADIGTHEFTYALYAWNGSLVESDVTREAAELNTPLRVAPVAVGDDFHSRSFVSCDSPSVVVDTVKLAEDESGDVIIRLYESARTTTSCRLQLGFPVHAAWETNMLERSLRAMEVSPYAVSCRLKPFEVKTIRLAWKKK